MEPPSSMKDASVAASLKSYREACSSSLGLSANTFIYSAIAVDYGREGQGSLQVVVAASNDSLIWTECVIRHGQTSMTKKNQIQNAHKGITCLRPLTSFFAPSPTAATLMTAGRDGLVKLWTATSGTSIIDFQTPNKQPISAIAHFANVNGQSYLAAGTELFEREPPGDVAIYVWALPDNIDPGIKGAPPILAITESHTDTITNLVFHASLPTNTTGATNTFPSPSNHIAHLISSSTDGLVTIIEPTIPDEDDSVQVVLNNRNAIQHIKPFTGPDHQFLQSGNICTISQDEKLAVHAIAEKTSESETSDPQPFDLRSELKCDYVIGLLEQQSGGSLVLAVGAFKEETTDSPHVDLYTFRQPPRPSEKPDLELVVRLQGAHGEEIVRDVWFQEGVPFMLTCGEDGVVRIWEEVVEGQSKSGKTPRKERKRAKEGVVGYKPY